MLLSIYIIWYIVIVHGVAIVDAIGEACEEDLVLIAFKGRDTFPSVLPSDQQFAINPILISNLHTVKSIYNDCSNYNVHVDITALHFSNMNVHDVAPLCDYTKSTIAVIPNNFRSYLDSIPIEMATRLTECTYEYSVLEFDFAFVGSLRLEGYYMVTISLLHVPSNTNIASYSTSKFYVNVAIDQGLPAVLPVLEETHDSDVDIYFSGHHCIGGSQFFPDSYPAVHLHKHFPLCVHCTELRVCHFKNVCLVSNSLKDQDDFNLGVSLQYFKDPELEKDVSKYYFPDGFNKEDTLFNVGYISNGIDIKVLSTSFPGASPGYKRLNVFFDSPSYSYSYGHAIIDNILSHFIAANIFEIDVNEVQLLFAHQCDQLYRASPYSDQIFNIPNFRRSQCLTNIKNISEYFFNSLPHFLSSDRPQEPICFENFIVGQGSAFSFKSLLLSRSISVRQFRDHLVMRHDMFQISRRRDTIQILVALQGEGIHFESGDSQLCVKVKHCISATPSRYYSHHGEFYSMSPPEVTCVVPEHLNFVDEVIEARIAHIIVSYGGTISYISLFAQSKTQHVIISDTLKDLNIFPWFSHVHPLYIQKQDYNSEICGVLLLAVKNFKSFDS